jgi:hypothetical protein
MSNCTTWLLWAQQDKFRSLGANFRGEHARIDMSEIVIGLTCLTAAIIAFWLLGAYLARRERFRRTYNPRGLFHELCHAHGLDRAGRTALWQLARQQELEHPARLFLEPERFDEPSRAPDEQGETYRRLRLKIFDESSGEAIEPNREPRA